MAAGKQYRWPSPSKSLTFKDTPEQMAPHSLDSRTISSVGIDHDFQRSPWQPGRTTLTSELPSYAPDNTFANGPLQSSYDPGQEAPLPDIWASSVAEPCRYTPESPQPEDIYMSSQGRAISADDDTFGNSNQGTWTSWDEFDLPIKATYFSNDTYFEDTGPDAPYTQPVLPVPRSQPLETRYSKAGASFGVTFDCEMPSSSSGVSGTAGSDPDYPNGFDVPEMFRCEECNLEFWDAYQHE